MFSFTELGQSGQWGNQIFQYAFVRVYARRHALQYGTGRWAGQSLYGFSDHEAVSLPPYLEPTGPDNHGMRGVSLPPQGLEVDGHDYKGYCQFHTSWYLPDRGFIQAMYADVVPPVRDRVVLALSRLRELGNTVISLHIRRGDCGRLTYFFTPVTWYLRWLQANWRRFDKPVLYLATEDTSLATYFKNYRPVLMEDLGLSVRDSTELYTHPYANVLSEKRRIDFFPDWYVLQHSDVIVASDSTFSFSAAWTSTRLREYWRARLSRQGFEKVDPWDADVSWREHLDDYPGIPGTQIDKNPPYTSYWRDFHPTHPSTPPDEAEILSLMAIPDLP